jgi:hypothetical protein
VTPGQDPDLRLLREALRREQQVQDRVLDLRHSGASLRTELREVAAVHAAHLQLLRRSVTGDDGVQTTARPDHPEPPPAERVRRLAAAEHGLAEAHAHAALDARSGPFARVLAGMAAAAEQQAHVLDGLATSVPRRG